MTIQINIITIRLFAPISFKFAHNLIRAATSSPRGRCWREFVLVFPPRMPRRPLAGGATNDIERRSHTRRRRHDGLAADRRLPPLIPHVWIWHTLGESEAGLLPIVTAAVRGRCILSYYNLRCILSYYNLGHV